MTNATCEPEICESGGSGLFWPPSYENEWPKGPRAILYLLLLLWLFMGVAIVADVFMGAIEKITSKKKTHLNKKDMTVKTVRVWNDTVANLTLMALGSSAPEILLNVIEIMANEFVLGKLGPSTIVGSAAFNLLIISGVCVIAIDSSEIRFIKDTGVYAITATFSVFAYVWLLVIVLDDEVHIWEGVVTFLFFPLLVGLAYMADVGMFCGSGSSEKIDFESLTIEEYSKYQMEILKEHGHSMTDEEIAAKMQEKYGKKASRAAYRVNATRQMVGAKRVECVEKATHSKANQVIPFEGEDQTAKKHTHVHFAAAAYTVMESIGTLKLEVIREGDIDDGTVHVDYKTRDGTAESGKDFVQAAGTVTFQKGETKKFIEVTILDDTDLETDENFFVDLNSCLCDDSKNVLADIGENKTAEVRIIDDDDPGSICFVNSMMKVSEDEDGKTKVISVHVERRNGSRGKIGVSYRTEDDSAKDGTDYNAVSGVLEIDNNMAEGHINIEILPRGRYEAEERFRIILEEPTGGATLYEDPHRDTTTCTIVIESDEAARERLDRVVRALRINFDKQSIATQSWKEQFTSALMVNGGEEGDEPPSIIDYIMHVLTVFWKVLFACIPPADFCDGWVCFFVALAMIGVVTAFIGDLANLTGCCMGLPAEITAITIVALGTSLPDTFASKTAATQDPYADASVGNVTGSNSVNVFLGLGLPWMMAAFYWESKGQKFQVDKGNLFISVATFCGCALAAIALLFIRRKVVGGELGGNAILKWVSFGMLISLWAVYIAVSSIVVVMNLTDDC